MPRAKLGDDDKLKVLMFGNPKQGKTTAAAGAARLGKVIAIDTEGSGWLATPLKGHGIPIENIVKYTATTYQEMEDTYWEIMGMFDDPDVEPPICVVIDHLSDLEKRFIRAETIRRTNKIRLPLLAKVKAGGVAGEVAKTALESVTQFHSEIQDYGVWTNQASHLMRMFRDLPCHVVFIAHFRTERGVRVPKLTEQFRVDIMGTMNMVLAYTRMQAGEMNAFVAHTQESDDWYAGDRFNILKPTIVNASMDRLIWSLEGKLDWNQDPEQKAFKQALIDSRG